MGGAPKEYKVLVFALEEILNDREVTKYSLRNKEKSVGVSGTNIRNAVDALLGETYGGEYVLESKTRVRHQRYLKELKVTIGGVFLLLTLSCTSGFYPKEYAWEKLDLIATAFRDDYWLFAEWGRLKQVVGDETLGRALLQASLSIASFGYKPEREQVLPILLVFLDLKTYTVRKYFQGFFDQNSPVYYLGLTDFRRVPFNFMKSVEEHQDRLKSQTMKYLEAYPGDKMFLASYLKNQVRALESTAANLGAILRVVEP